MLRCKGGNGTVCVIVTVDIVAIAKRRQIIRRKKTMPDRGADATILGMSVLTTSLLVVEI